MLSILINISLNFCFNSIDPVSKLPKLVRPRVLALDGDGMKLIVQLKILQLIAKVSGLKVLQSLTFHLIFDSVEQ